MAGIYNYIVLSMEEPDKNVLWAKPSNDNMTLELLAFSSGRWRSLVGTEGKSAYEEALDKGYVGSFEEWLMTMKGPKGDTGDTGQSGPQGEQGVAGRGIESISYSSETSTSTTYIMTFSDGSTFAFTVPKGQKGDKGDTGETGATGPQGEKGDKGDKGDTGAAGTNGTNGTNGIDGEDAYQPFKGWFDSSSDLENTLDSPEVGDYAYVKGATASDPVAIYQCATAGTWTDSGNEFNPANNQEFLSGESLNTVRIVDDLTTGGATNVLSAKQGKVLDEKIGQLGPKVNGVTLDKSSATTGTYYNCGNASGTYSGATANMSGFRYYPIITLQKGQSISIAVLGGDGGRAYCITDATTNEILAKATRNQDLRESPFTYTATKAVKVYINDKTPYDGVVVVGGTIDAAISSIQQDSDALRQDVDGLQEDSQILKNDVIGFVEHPYEEVVSLETGSFWNLQNISVGSVYNGTVGELPTGEWRRWERALIKEGQKVTIATYGGANARAYCITDAVTNVVLDIAPASTSYIDEPYEYIAETDCYLYVNTSKRFEGSWSEIADKTLGERVNELNDKIDEIEQEITPLSDVAELFSEEYSELFKVNDLTPTVIATDGTLTESLSGFHVNVYEVQEGDEIEVSITRATTDVANRLSGCFYSTNDEENYNIVSIEGFERWRYNGNTEVNYRVVTPQGANRVGISGGNINARITAYSVQKREAGKMKSVEEEADNIISATNEVRQHSPASLDERVTALEEDDTLPSTSKINNPRIDIRHSATLKILDIGNSFTVDALSYMQELISASGLDVGNICVYKLVRSSGSFKLFLDSWNNEDVYNGSTGCFYSLSKQFGGLSATINGSTNLEKMHSALKDEKWDIIVFHQVTQAFSLDYKLWEGDTSAGHLLEFVRLLKTYQPQAMLGYLWTQASWLHSTEGDTLSYWEAMKKGIMFLQSHYNVDFIVPIGTAIENLRSSSLNTPPVAYGFTRDSHHLGYGLARYVAAATYYQTLFGQRYGVTVLGNPCVHSVSSSEKAQADYRHPDDCIDVTSENKELAQICAILACGDMFTVQAPDGVTI